ncbi:MAG: TonB family protein [Pontiellaceae bacterium]|nr:TonB family protein [Pontiellaceae bacterium]
MTRFTRRVVLRVLGIHAAVVLFVLLQSMLQGCFHPEPKREIVTFIEFGQPAPAPNVQEVDHMDEPEQVEEPAPPEEVTPTPQVVDPPPRELPVPVPKDPVPVDPTPKEQKVLEPPPKKNNWTAAKVDDIKVAPLIDAPRAQTPKINVSEAFSDLTASSNAGNPDEIAAYDALINKAFHNAWVQPAAPASRPAKITISISSTGRITGWKLSQSSGDAEYDESVRSAAKRITVLPRKPPTGYPLKDIVIQFNVF